MKRRDFIIKSGIAAAGFPLVISNRSARAASVASSDQINLGFIGVGGMGGGHVRSFLGYPDVRITAICDVRDSHALESKARVDEAYGNNDCVTCRDYRELLARKDIDAVCIAVPDHWHAIIGIEAARQGKHMYYEKPMSMSVRESQALRAAVRKYGVVFQFGTQQRSNSRFRSAVELFRNGKLGVPQTVMIGSANFKPVPDQPVEPVPEDLDYDMWLGPAPWSPYTTLRCTRNWTLIRDYSLGCLSGAWGIHHVDIAQLAFNKDFTGPVTTEAWGEYPPSGLYDTVIAWQAEHVYADGSRILHMDMPTALKHHKAFELAWMGVLFEGSEGWIYVTREFITSEPANLLEIKLGGNDFRLPPSNDHRRNFLDAVKTGITPMSHIEAATHSDMVCHHADIAMRTGRKLQWDPEKEVFINDAQANRLLDRPMRAPWHLS